MTEPEHSPLPWHIYKPYLGTIRDSDGAAVAIVSSLGNSDARLIVTAVNARADLLAAAKEALAHVLELEDAWRRGSLTECDGGGGTRSNRNVDVRASLYVAIAKAETLS